MAQKNETIPVYTLADRGDKLSQPFRLVEMTPMKEGSYDYSNPHRHAYYEVFYFESGGGDHEIDFAHREIAAPAIHFVSPGQIHRVRRSADSHGCVILFTDEFYHLNLANRAILQEMPMLRGESEAGVINLDEQGAAEIAPIIGMIRTESENRSEYHDDAIRSLLNLLLITSRRIAERQGLVDRETSDSQLLRRYRDAIEERFTSIHAVSAYARHLNLTPGHLNDTVREQTGKTASTLIHERIILEAKRLLVHSEASVKEIAYALGFDDPSYFTRFFRERVEATPGEFRGEFKIQK